MNYELYDNGYYTPSGELLTPSGKLLKLQTTISLDSHNDMVRVVRRFLQKWASSPEQKEYLNKFVPILNKEYSIYVNDSVTYTFMVKVANQNNINVREVLILAYIPVISAYWLFVITKGLGWFL